MTQGLLTVLALGTVWGLLTIALTCDEQSGPGRDLGRRQRATIWVGAGLSVAMLGALCWIALSYGPTENASGDAGTVYFGWFGLMTSFVQFVVAGQPKLLRHVANSLLACFALLALWLASRVDDFVSPVSVAVFVITLAGGTFTTWETGTGDGGAGAEASRRRTKNRCHLATVRLGEVRD